jgi:hypothetical protein
MAFRIFLLTGWLLLPVVGLAWHLGPGQEQKALDETARHLRDAEKLAAGQQYAAAVGAYADALKALPEGRTAEARKIRLERAKAQMLAKQLPEAHGDLRGLVDELAADPSGDQKLLADARTAYANSQYYMTWLMRLEGMSRDEWEPEVESARQLYKLLATDAERRGDTASVGKHKEDLEATIRLARMDLGELQGLPLPSQ